MSKSCPLNHASPCSPNCVARVGDACEFVVMAKKVSRAAAAVQQFVKSLSGGPPSPAPPRAGA